MSVAASMDYDVPYLMFILERLDLIFILLRSHNNEAIAFENVTNAYVDS
jgi:hypothetical protein